MRNEKVSCPHCNELMWLNVPDDMILASVGTTSWETWHAKQKCPNCGKKVYLYYRAR